MIKSLAMVRRRRHQTGLDSLIDLNDMCFKREGRIKVYYSFFLLSSFLLHHYAFSLTHTHTHTKGIPVPCTEGQWHAARMYDDVRNGHSYVMHQWIDYLKEKRVLTNEVAFEGNLKFDPIPIRIASLLATGLDSVRVIEDITKDSKRNTNILSGALCNIASESSRLTARLNRGRRESKTSSSRRGRRNAIVSVPVGIISPHSRRKNRNRHNMITEQAVSHCSHVYSHQQSCPCVLSLKNGIITSTPRNQPEEVRSPFSFRSRIKPITIPIDSNVCVRKITNTLCFSILIGNDLQKEEMRFRCKTLEDRVRWVRSIRIASRRFADLRTIREETEYLLTELQRDVEDFDTITRDISRKYREQERIVEHALSVFNQLRLCDVPGVRWDMPSCVDG